MSLFYTHIRKFSTGLPKKLVHVTVVNADTRLGSVLSFLLKQNPDVDLLSLQGPRKFTEGIAVDLSHIQTSTLIHSYHGGEDAVIDSIRSADIIFLLSQTDPNVSMPIGELTMCEGEKALPIIKMCAKYSPRAILVVCAKPVSVLVPIAKKIYQETPFYSPGKIIGSVAYPQLKVNTVTANYLDLDPKCVRVPIYGGPDLDCCCPLFSQAEPVNIVGKEAEKLLKMFRHEETGTEIAEAYALCKMASAISAGLKNMETSESGESNIISAFVRSNIVETCRHIVAKVKFGPSGVVHNFGLPRLLPSELKLFEKCTLMLRERELMAMEYLSREGTKPPPFLLKERSEAEEIKTGILR